MTDKSLLEDLRLFQDLTAQEAEVVAGGTDLAVPIAKPVSKMPPLIKPPLGGCPTCISGIPFDLAQQELYSGIVIGS